LFDNWVLGMSSAYPHTQNTREALLDLNSFTGAATNKEQNPWISATYSQPMLVGSVELLALCNTQGGWNSSYTNTAQFQFFNPSGGWENLFTIAGLVDNVAKKFDFPKSISSTAFRLVLPRQGWLSIALLRLRP